MATTNPSLFGMLGDEAAMQRQLDEQRAQAFAQQTQEQRLASMGYSAGAGLGRGIAGAFGVDVTDPVVRQATQLRQLASEFDTTTPEGMMQFAQAARSISPDVAQKAALQAQGMLKTQSEITKNLRETKAASLDEKLFLELAKKADPASVAEARKAGNDISLLKITGDDKISTYGQVLKDAGFTPGTPQFQLKMGEFAIAELQGAREGKGTKVIMPGGGAAKVSDVATFGSQVNTVLKPFKEDFEVADTALKMIDTNNPKAAAQVDRALARASGDSQLSQAEVLEVASAGSFPQRAVDSISKFFTGGSGKLSVEQKRDVLEAFKNAAAKRHDTEQQRLSNLFSTSELSKQQVEAGLGKRLSMQTSFNSVAEAEAAKLPKGTKITIGGRPAIVE